VAPFGGYVLHAGTLVRGSLAPGARLACAVDYARRRKVAPNHTVTHLLQLALREQLGDGVRQRGSSCDDARLRFDFSHAGPVAPAQLAAVQARVRGLVAAALPVHSAVVPLARARSIGALCEVEGEAYPNPKPNPRPRPRPSPDLT